MRLFIGTVREFNKDDWTIRFRVENIIDNMNDSEYPRAMPIGPHTVEPLIDSTVLIIQYNEVLSEFGWHHLHLDSTVGLRFGHNSIDLSDENAIMLKILDETDSEEVVSLVYDNSNGVTLSTTEKLTVKADGVVSLTGPNDSSIKMDSLGKISLNNHLTVEI